MFRKFFFITAVLGGFLLMNGGVFPSAEAEQSYGICSTCTKNCDELGIPWHETSCRVKFDSPHTPHITAPECPKGSSYRSEEKKCMCFEGMFSYSREGGICVNDLPLETLCESAFGKHITSSETANACFCREGYEMKNGKCLEKTDENISSIPTKDLLSHTRFGYGRDFYENLGDFWRIASRILVSEKARSAEIRWKLTSEEERAKVSGYSILIWDTEKSAWAFSASLKGGVRSVTFPLENKHTYKIHITAFDSRNEVMNTIQFYVES
ncbi:fibronectin type III domain-containing protein [Candidatus Peregrinibacteria bacterium]|nr:fibronectin type III domain-containing protein [Candidatus Peregrinibacteria bacterium]